VPYKKSPSGPTLEERKMTRDRFVKLAMENPKYRAQLLRLAKEAEPEADPKNLKKFEELARKRIQDAVARGGVDKALKDTGTRIKRMKEPVKAQALFNVLEDMEKKVKDLKTLAQAKM